MKDIKILTENGVDVNASLELFGDMETYNETLNDFLESVDKKIADIKKYKESTDMPNYAVLVHSLKSDSKYLGFKQLAEMSYQHELRSKENDLDFVQDNFDDLMKEASRVIDLVKRYNNNETTNTKEVGGVLNGKTILVVDDSDIIRNFIKKIFKHSAHRREFSCFCAFIAGKNLIFKSIV